VAHDPEITGSRPLGRELPCPRRVRNAGAPRSKLGAPAHICMYAASTDWSRNPDG
jgi:hypothetical protein